MTNHKRIILAIIFCFTIYGLKAQTTDLARIEYLRIPFSNGDQSLNRFRGLLQAPIPIKENYLVFGFEYRNLDLDFRDDAPFDRERLQNTHQIEGTVGFVKKLKNKNWRIAAKTGVRIASNLERSLVNDDLIYLGAIYAINDVKNDDENEVAVGKPYRLIFGLIYSTAPGRNYPIPLINYFREINDKWSYTAGVPKSLLRYSFNDKNHLQTFVTLDGFFANIQDNIHIAGSDRVGENISMTNVIAGIGYEHYFTDHLLFYSYAGYTLYNEYRIRDNDREDVYVIENDNTFYIRSGIKFKI